MYFRHDHVENVGEAVSCPTSQLMKPSRDVGRSRPLPKHSTRTPIPPSDSRSRPDSLAVVGRRIDSRCGDRDFVREPATDSGSCRPSAGCCDTSTRRHSCSCCDATKRELLMAAKSEIVPNVTDCGCLLHDVVQTDCCCCHCDVRPTRCCSPLATERRYVRMNTFGSDMSGTQYSADYNRIASPYVFFPPISL